MTVRDLLAIDQGTTSTRAVLFEAKAQTKVKASHQIELKQIYPANGWVEHDPEEIWHATRQVGARVLRKASLKATVIGITNQRETTVLWERVSAKPLANAIVWQDRRTAERCAALRAAGHAGEIARRTGLLPDPYFSATKLEWLLSEIPGARERAAKGELCFGTIDSWLIFKLTGGRAHVTDVTNAARTMLLNLGTLQWDEAMLELFGIPRAMLPEVRDSAGDFGVTDPAIFGAAIPIRGVAGDQQAAMVGQGCFAPGDVKSTYGTGCFALVNTGPVPVHSANRLLATPAYRAGGQTAYAVEGSIFVAGAVVQWLRDEMGLIKTSADIEALARRAKPAEGLYFIPAFTGLGAPYWDPDARGAIIGLTRDSGAAEIAHAALDAVCFQTRDLLEAMGKDMAQAGLAAPKALKVDGGMVENDWFCQRLADLTGLPVDRPKLIETTALGAAYLAGLGSGVFIDFAAIAKGWALGRRFLPQTDPLGRDALYSGWCRAVARVRGQSLV